MTVEPRVPEASPAGDEAARLLLVEDDGIVLRDLSRSMEAAGHRVVATARTGEGAVEAARGHRPDLALMDVRLDGDMDGVEAGSVLLDEMDLPVVYLTAYADPETRRRVRRTAPFGYVVKPYDERDLQTAVEVALLRSRLETRLRRTRRAAEERGRMLERILDTTAAGILLTDPEGRFEYANPAAERILGLERSAIGDRSYRDPDWGICAPDGGPFPDEQLPVARVLRTGEAVTDVEHGVEHADGGRVVLSVNAAPLEDPDGGLTGVVASIRDVTDRKEFEAQLEHRALHDYLTGLPNRALFRDRLEQTLHRVRRTGERLAVGFLDLKRFKVVNDSLGHEAGDRVLKEVARRLEAAVRAEDTVARVGGDEFTVLLARLEGGEEAEEVGRRITEAFADPIGVGPESVPMEASLGLVLHDPAEHPDADASGLVRCADAAMYRARERPGTAHVLATSDETAPESARLERETRLRRALEEGDVGTVYQPLFATGSGELRGVEALARWRDEELGDVPPGTFIPLAEETGLIARLGEQQLERACREVLDGELSSAGSDGPLRLHVNFSARQLEDPDVTERIRRILERTGFPPDRLYLEITESAAMRQPEIVDELTELGVLLALDDFGTRYSTLSQLRRLSTDALKIDRTFVDGLVEDDRDCAIVETILTLGRSLGLDVVAEGVESEEQLAMLRDLGCGEAQGFHLGRPQPPAELRASLDGKGIGGRAG